MIKELPIHVNQHGFRTDRSTETAISEVTNYIEQHIFYGQHVIATFLDIQAAFDTISPLQIKLSLENKNVDKNLIEWN